MKRAYVGAVLTGLAFAVGACKGDPTSSLRNGATCVPGATLGAGGLDSTCARLSVTPNQFFIDTGITQSLVVTARDAQLNPIAVVVNVTSANAAVAKVARDTTRPPVDSSTYSFSVTGGTPGQTKLIITAGGLTDTAVVSVFPLAFTGALSSLTPKGGDTLTIHSTAVLKFNPATATVTFGGGEVAKLVVVTADSIRVLVPFSTPAPLAITGVLLTFIPGLETTLNTSATVAQTGDRWAGDGSWQTAPDITPYLPTAGKSKLMISGSVPSNAAVCPEVALAFGSSGPCTMFKLTLADTATLNFTTDWEGAATNPDVDVYACADSTVANFGAACFEDGGAGATGAKPQSTGPFKYAAGTHYFVIEVFAGSSSKNYITTIAHP